MPDLKTRFHGADRIPTPHLWEAITSREPRPLPPKPSVTRRVLIAAFAFVLAVAVIALVVRAFNGGLQPTPGMSPSIAPKANGVIAFVSGSDIYVVQPDGSLGKLSGPAGPGYDAAPARWSPDGSEIAFLYVINEVEGGAHYELYVMNADGTGVTRLASNDAGDPHWAPDGTKIAFDENDGLYLVNADGSSLRKLASGQYATWSPDGTKIAYEGPGGLYETNADGSAQTKLVDGGFSPAWSPDGSKIAFVTTQGGNPEIDVVNADGTGETRLTDIANDDMGPPVWSPDGTEIAFEALRNGNYDVYVVNANGADLKDLTNDPLDENVPTWSPDGKQIAFVAGKAVSENESNQRTFDVYVMNASGAARTRLTQGLPPDYALSWQPVPASGESPTPTESPSPTPPRTAPRVVATIDLGQAGQVSSLRAADGSIWAAGYDAVGSAWVKRIEPATNRVVATIPLQAGPWWDFGGGGIAASEGAIWVTGPGRLPDGGTEAILSRVDPSTNTVVWTTSLGGQDGGDVVADDTAVWVLVFREATSPEVLRLDPGTGDVVARIPLESDFSRTIFEEAGAIWVPERRERDPVGSGNYLAKIDPATNSIAATFDVGRYGGFTPGQGLIWAGWGYGLIRFDPETGDFVGDPIPVGSAIAGAGLRVGEGGVWFFGYDDTVDSSPRTLERYDLASGQVGSSLTLTGNPIDTALSPGSVWVLNHDGALVRIDLS
jgi:Tol biopolymer transport system component